MRIIQITPGIIPIPPNGWGAVEKIIWEYKLKLDELGVQTDIRFLNEVRPGDADIVHIHMANLAIEAKKRGIPYVFSLHDHHVFHYGKDSFNYNQNLEAIKGSIISFCHAEYLVDYFDETDKLFYLSHGVESLFFRPLDGIKTEMKLLCLANNGLAGDSTYDRKGFRQAVEAAKILDLPITIAGPENNKLFFDANPDLTNYNKLTLILNNPDEIAIRDLYQSHAIFLHPSSLEAGHPNLTILEALSSGVPVVGTYRGTQNLNGMFCVQKETNSVASGIIEVINNYEYYINETKKIPIKYDWRVIVKRLLKMYETINIINKPYDSEETRNLYINEYNNSNKQNVVPKKDDIKINYNFAGNGPEVEILGNNTNTYVVNFYDDNNELHYTNTMKCNTWVRLNRRYFTKWRIEILDEDKNEVFGYTLNYTNKRVFIVLDSKSLGDTIAWVPYVEEFRKKHGCKVICSTFKNELFAPVYPNIEFVSPGSVVYDIHGMYTIGWHYNSNLEPEIPNTIPLQKAATNILGLEFHEIKPEIILPIKNRPIEDEYIAIAVSSTAQLKLWNYPDAWNILCKQLISMGYKVINVSMEPSNIPGVGELTDTSLLATMNVIYHSKLLIGLSSGLSWLAWAMGKKTIMISNFSKPDHEYQSNCHRITNKEVCNGCWNNPMFKFDKGDWMWCPEHKDTPRQFECSTSITPQMVMDTVKIVLEDINNE